MHLPIPDFRPYRNPEPPALVSVARPDVTWNRWVFKAPPLVLDPRALDARTVAEELRRAARNER